MPNEELLVWYGEGYAENLGIDLEHDPNMPVVDPSKCVFICNILLQIELLYSLRILLILPSLCVGQIWYYHHYVWVKLFCPLSPGLPQSQSKKLSDKKGRGHITWSDVWGLFLERFNYFHFNQILFIYHHSSNIPFLFIKKLLKTFNPRFTTEGQLDPNICINV